MGKLKRSLLGSKVLEEVESPINGEVSVIKNLAFGTYIQVEGLTQSGGVIKNVWKSTLKRLKNKKTKELKNVLILGLGGGTAAGLVRENWPEAKIVGVDLDPVFIELGKKYLNLDDINVDIKIMDAYEFLSQRLKAEDQKFDLILNDVYVGSEVPEKLESEDYIHLVRNLLSESGLAVFNRLYYGDNRKGAVKFREKLEEVFENVDIFYPEVNAMYICSG